jgi:hypothetical protein
MTADAQLGHRAQRSVLVGFVGDCTIIFRAGKEISVDICFSQ